MYPSEPFTRTRDEQYDLIVVLYHASEVEDLALETSLEAFDNWEIKLEESNEPELAPIAENLRQLLSLPTGGLLDHTAIVGSMTVLSEQVREVASGELGAGITGELRQLGELIDARGRTILEEE